MDYDVAVIGAGPGGYVAAIRAAQLGGKVALIESAELGGTCLNRGCIPTKALIESVRVLKLAQRGGEYGVRVPDATADYAAMSERKNAVVENLRKGIAMLLKKNKVDILTGRGTLLDRDRVRVATDQGEKDLTASSVILATGSKPMKPSVFPFDGERVITSEEALAMTEVPESVLVVGGGYIGAEWAGILSGAGAKVTLVEMMERLLPRQDPDLSKELLRAFKKAKMKTHLGVKVQKVVVESNSVVSTLSNGNEVWTDKVLVAVGRQVNSDDLGLDAAGVRTESGAILVDEHCRTNVPNIYAIGDVTAKLMLAHVASRQGVVAAQCAMGDETSADLRAVPACVFTDPEIGTVGKSSQECAEEGLEVREASFPFAGLGKARAVGETAGWVKIVAEEKTGVVVGVHIIGAHASDLIAEAGLAMSMEATVEDIAHAIHAHPTLAEGIFECAESWLGRPVHS